MNGFIPNDGTRSVSATTGRFSPPKHEPQLARDQRRAGGVYYTPPEIVRQIVELTLGPQCGPLAPRVDSFLDNDSAAKERKLLRILDPACGAGEFLLEAQRFLQEKCGDAGARAALHGMDIDASAVKVTRERLGELPPAVWALQIIVDDALTTDALPPGVFDAVIGNPPYVNIRQLAKTLPRERIDALRQRYQTARGNFDLYVLFIERALELLKPGGRCGLIIPNKWAALDYARPCRELLLEQATIERVIDLSAVRAFARASVYPHILIFRKEPATPAHVIRFSSGHASHRDSELGHSAVPQRVLSPAGFSFESPLDVESRVPTMPLAELATLSCGTAGFSAQRIARRLLDLDDVRQKDVPDLADFITSGNIDRYTIRLGNVRYLHRDYVQPKLPLVSPELTPAKRKLFASPKIVVAGMSQRLEAAWDDRGLALGVQVFAASQPRVDPFYLLALLNSKLLSYLFATRFASKRLAGGYLAVNKSQLARLPIVVGTLRVPSAAVKRLAALAATWSRHLVQHKASTSGPGGAERHAIRLTLDAEIDQLIYDLYGLTEAEITRVERHFQIPAARAA